MRFLLLGVVLWVGVLGATDMMQAHHAAVLVACCLTLKRRLIFEGMAFVEMGVLLASMRWCGLAASTPFGSDVTSRMPQCNRATGRQVSVDPPCSFRGPLVELVHSTLLERDGVRSQSVVPTLPMNEALRMETALDNC